MSATPTMDRLAELEAALAAQEMKARAVQREAQEAQEAVRPLGEQLLELRAQAAAGRDVAKDLQRAEKALEAAETRAAEPWRDRVALEARAAQIRRQDVQAFAVEHRDELWSEAAPVAEDAVRAVREAVGALEDALRALEDLHHRHGHLCSVTGGNPRESMPLSDRVSAKRRELRGFAADLEAPLPRVQAIARATTPAAVASGENWVAAVVE